MHSRVHPADTCCNCKLVIGGDLVDRAWSRRRRSPELGIQHKQHAVNFYISVSRLSVVAVGTASKIPAAVIHICASRRWIVTIRALAGWPASVLAKTMRLSPVERRRFVDLIRLYSAGLRSDCTMPLAVVMKLARVAQGSFSHHIASNVQCLNNILMDHELRTCNQYQPEDYSRLGIHSVTRQRNLGGQHHRSCTF